MPSSLTRFHSRALASWCHPTCVGFGTARSAITRRFSWRPSRAPSEGTNPSSASRLSLDGARICLCPGLSACTPTSIGRRRWLSACVFAQTRASGTGMLACCPSAAPFGLALGADSPRADEPGPGNLGIPASGIPTPIFVTHVRIIAPKRSSGPSGPPSTPLGTLFYHAPKGASTTSAGGLTPDHFRRGISRPVSCYALFKWWLPLSQHPGCPRNLTSLVTEPPLGALVGGLGCFPLDREA